MQSPQLSRVEHGVAQKLEKGREGKERSGWSQEMWFWAWHCLCVSECLEVGHFL